MIEIGCLVSDISFRRPDFSCSKEKKNFVRFSSKQLLFNDTRLLPTLGSTAILYSCPNHPNDTLEKKETITKYDHWECYKYPVQNCYVSCGVDNLEHCLDSAKHPLHNIHLSKPLHITTSQRGIQGDFTHNVPNVRWCDFFQWLNQAYGRVSYVLEWYKTLFLE